jgi:hypothetical protein
MLAEEFLPVYDVSDELATVVAADPSAVWAALLRTDVIEVGKRTPLAADGRSLLSGLMRTAATDEHARRWFRRYRTFGVGSGAHILVHALLEMVRETAERAQTATQVQAG